MNTHISADLGRFLVAGVANTLLTAVIYFAGLLVLSPAISYGVAWLAGVVFVMWVYPDRVFVGSGAVISQRVALGLTIAAVFFAGEAVLNFVVFLTGRADFAFVVALAVTFTLNFLLSRLLMRTEILNAGLLERAATAIFITLPIACLCWMAVQWLNHGIDLPYFDDWRDYYSGNIASLSPAYLFRPANDTIYAVGKALDALAFRLFHGNSVVYQFLSMSIVLGSLLALQWKLLKAAQPDRLLCAAAFSLTILMIQPGSYWGIQNLAYHQALPLVFILASIYIVVVANWPWSLRAAALFVLGMLSGLTYISGSFAILTLALAILVCIAVNRRVFLSRLPDAATLLVAGLITTTIQAWVILFRQNGHIHTGTAWALPTNHEFWLYLFGKLGRSLMLPSNAPLLSLIVVAALFAAAAAVAIISFYKVALAKDRNAASTRAALVTLLLFASIFCYLLMVAAGRTDLRGANVSKPLEIFAFGFLRFHFFWATLIWPWALAGAVALWPEKTPVQRAIAASLAAVVVVFAVARGVFNHDFFFLRDSERANVTAECLRQELMNGSEIYCPRLYPTEMTQAYANAVKMGASFVRYFPPSLLGARDKTAGVDILAGHYSIVNATYAAGTDDLALNPGKDVQVHFSLGDPNYLKNCLAVRADVQLETDQSTIVQLFYRPKGWRNFSPSNVETLSFDAKSTEPLGLVAVSPTGFQNDFRFDPVSGSQPATISDFTLKCVLRKSK